MKNITFLFPALLMAFFLQIGGLAAQSTGMVKKVAVVMPSEKTETVQVMGNCGMCKKTIEKAAVGAGATKANWDVDKDLLTVTFNPAKTNIDAIELAVAQSGYDNIGYKAPDEAYKNLHECCQYDRSGAPGTAKSCPSDKQ